MRDDGNAAAHLQRAEQLYVVGRFRGVARQANGGLVVPRRNRRSRFLLATRFRIGYFFKKANPPPNHLMTGTAMELPSALYLGVPDAARVGAAVAEEAAALLIEGIGSPWLVDWNSV